VELVEGEDRELGGRGEGWGGVREERRNRWIREKMNRERKEREDGEGRSEWEGGRGEGGVRGRAWEESGKE